MTLPIEVIEHILSFFQSHLLDDIDTLKICAQSHPTLSELAERYIYADIELIGDPVAVTSRTLMPDEFARVLADRPEIAFHVRSLKVYVHPEDGADPEYDQAYLATIASLLPLFSGLTEIALVANTYRWAPLSWNILPEKFRQAFLHIIQLPSMKAIYIDDMAFPMSVLDTCKNVTVALDACTNIQYDEDSREEPSYAAVKHLSLRYCEDTSLLAWVQKHKLRSLKFKGPIVYDGGFFPQLLAACSHSLTNLELDIDRKCGTSFKISPNGIEIYNNPVHFLFTLAGLCHLERFTIIACLTTLPNVIGKYFESPVPAITELVHTVSPTLKQIHLEFRFRFEKDPDPNIIWSPFIPLVAKCSSRCIKVYITPRLRMPSCLSRSDFSSSIAGCAGLVPYVKQGVFVVL